MDALEAIKKRRSVRSFLDTKVERKDLLTILEAGLTGPSACNRRPWEFVVVEDRTTLDALSKGNLAAKPLLSAPLAIVVMGNTDKAIRRAPLYWTEDASAATENMIIAASSLSIGSLWMGVWPEEEKIRRVREVLSVPENIVPFSILALGYPKDEGSPMWAVSEGREKAIHWGKW